MSFEQKVKRFIEKYHMLSEGAGILVGLSGGADSVALLEVLCDLQESWKLRIAALHVHHGVRQEAWQDVEFCKHLCEEKGVVFYYEYADVPKLAEEWGISVEEAGRKVRYKLFEEYRQKLQFDLIAVAHHQNDQAETMLFQLFRGSGLRGMAGIPMQRGCIVRPLAGVSRKEIEEYLESRRQDFVVDATNLTDIYTRNKIRQHMLPLAEEIAPGAIANMNRTAAQLREIQEFMEEQAEKFLRENGQMEEQKGVLHIRTEPLREIHPALQKMVIMTAIEKAFYSRRDITEKHVHAILDLLHKDGEKNINLPKGGVVVKSYDRLTFQPQRMTKNVTDAVFEQMEIQPNATYFLPDGRILETELILGNKIKNIPKSDCLKWFDYDKITGVLVLRNREKGDFLTINEHGARKKLQDYLINEKIPKSVRDELLVLADGPHIVWVPGMRISAYYKVTEQTQKILQVYIGGEEHGRKS
jgi:tRNA(Ile)-lysidine synthase